MRPCWARSLPSAVLAAGLLVAVGACGPGHRETAGPPRTPGSTSPTPAADASPTAIGISPSEAGQIVPLAPARVTAVATSGEIEIRWPGTGQDAVHYQVYRRANGAKDWQPLTTIQAVGDDKGQYQVTDSSGMPGTSYLYGVAAVSPYGKESTITPSEPAAFPAG